MMNSKQQHTAPALLKAIELILARPEDIRQKVQKTKEKYYQRHDKTLPEHRHLNNIADKLISSYSTKAGLSGGATGLIGVVPGLGTAVELVGGATADIALCLKYQIEMSMALAALYGHDIENEGGKKQYYIIASLSTINMETIRQGGEQAAKIFTKMANRYLRDASFETVKIVFRKVSLTLSKKALQKAIPFGIGAVIGFSSNKTLTWMAGQRVKVFFATPAS